MIINKIEHRRRTGYRLQIRKQERKPPRAGDHFRLTSVAILDSMRRSLARSKARNAMNGKMTNDDKVHEMRDMLRKYSTRPPLKFSTDAEIPKLARKILAAARGRVTVWTKWGAEREELASRAVDVWIPLDDLREALNKLPGERLTAVDVEQRIYALRHDVNGCARGPDKELQEESFAAYATEKANGTEFVTLLGWLE